MVLTDSAARMGAEYFAARAQVPLAVTVEQIARNAATGTPASGGFLPFDSAKTYPMPAGHAVWLHFRVRGGPAALGDWTLVLSKPFIDRAEFYFQDAQGVWHMEAAGTRVAHQLWPVRALTPQFHLPDTVDTLADGAGVRDFYLRVQKWIPLRFAAQLQRTERVSEQTQNTFLSVGLSFGLLSFMFIFSCVLTAVYRHKAYAWYAAYVVAALMSAVSFSGMGSYALWTGAVSWPVISTMVFVMLGMAAQLGFTRAIFIAPDTPKVWSQLMAWAMGLTLLACAVFSAVDHRSVRVPLFGLVVLAGFALIAVVAVRALRYDRAVAVLYLVSFTPMLVVVGLTQIEQLGLVALPWLPYNAPTFALLLELPLLLVALHLHAKNRHARAIRRTTLANTDPLTGFVAPHLFAATLSKLWAAALANGTDLSVVYIKAAAVANAGLPVQPADSARGVLHTVRLLRTVAREDDTVARVDDQLFAMLMPGVSRSERLASKLSRLVALGVMVDPDDSRSSPVKFKITASSVRSFSGQWEQLDSAMKNALALDDGWQQRAIRFMGKRPHQPVVFESASS